MSAEESKALARRFYEEAVNKGNMALLDELVPTDYIQHNPLVPQGREGVKQFLALYGAAFPDVRIDVEDIVAAGDRVVARWTMRGTHKGDFLGIPATGKPVTVTGMDIWRVAGGQLVEHWDAFDNLGMLQQLGAIPSPGQPGG